MSDDYRICPTHRLEEHFGVDAHRLLVDQVLGELACARAEFGKKVRA